MVVRFFNLTHDCLVRKKNGLILFTSLINHEARHFSSSTKTECRNPGSGGFVAGSSQSPSLGGEFRKNNVNVQLLSKSLQAQVFGGSPTAASETQPEILNLSLQHLRKHSIPFEEDRPVLPDISADIPKLVGKDIEDHFWLLGDWLGRPYYKLANNAASIDTDAWVHGLKVPEGMEKNWIRQPGWSRYDGTSGKYIDSVEYPIEEVIVFDVETSPAVEMYPLLAVALSPKYMYCWVSPLLCSEVEQVGLGSKADIPLIPMGDFCSLCIGHNVSFDRARIKEEYSLERSQRRFLDTLSLHCAVSGLSSQQRGSWASFKKKQGTESISSLHNEDIIMEDGSQFVATDLGLNRETVREDEEDASSAWMYQSSLNNLADAVRLHCDGYQMDKSTVKILIEGTLKDIRENFAAIATYCANDTTATFALFKALWPKYLAKCPHPVSFSAMLEMGSCFLPVTKQWKDYMNHCEELFMQSTKQINSLLADLAEKTMERGLQVTDKWLTKLDWTPLPAKYTKPKYKKDGSFAKNGEPRPIGDVSLFGKPAWYRKLLRCDGESRKKHVEVTSKSRILPYLLKLKWEGKPVHYIDEHGWCYEDPKGNICDIYTENSSSTSPTATTTTTSIEVDREGKNSTKFSKVPHHESVGANVGCLLGKNYLKLVEKGILSCEYPEIIGKIVETYAAFTFWAGYRERISQQLVIWEGENGIDQNKLGWGGKGGMIIPCLIPMGTVTRRAVEPTWMTATNPKAKLVGSELKAQIMAPPGFTFIGADVDSQELWIASLLGDAQFGFPGATALGWMTLQGAKSDGSDLHSRTAAILGMCRDNAKVFNYGRIYGAGAKYASQLMQKFNPNMDEASAKEKARLLYASTKGRRVRGKLFPESSCSMDAYYTGGTETFMFNQLEKIANSAESRTPALSAVISNSLLKSNVKEEYLTSRINWAVQSSGVDYLHLLIVAMSYLAKKYEIPARLVITIHDEVRYIVPQAEQYRAALALQIANLWTRALFAYRVGMSELPLSVAFFSAVDFDSILRKETNLTCVTPSNPTPIPPGFALNIYELLKKLPAGSPIKKKESNDPQKTEQQETEFDNNVKLGLDRKVERLPRLVNQIQMLGKGVKERQLIIRKQMDEAVSPIRGDDLRLSYKAHNFERFNQTKSKYNISEFTSNQPRAELLNVPKQRGAEGKPQDNTQTSTFLLWKSIVQSI